MKKRIHSSSVVKYTHQSSTFASKPTVKVYYNHQQKANRYTDCQPSNRVSQIQNPFLIDVRIWVRLWIALSSKTHPVNDVQMSIRNGTSAVSIYHTWLTNFGQRYTRRSSKDIRQHSRKYFSNCCRHLETKINVVCATWNEKGLADHLTPRKRNNNLATLTLSTPPQIVDW